MLLNMLALCIVGPQRPGTLYAELTFCNLFI